MKNNALTRLATFGQSLWLVHIRRDLFAGGELRRMIEDDGLRGRTSNPYKLIETLAQRSPGELARAI